MKYLGLITSTLISFGFFAQNSIKVTVSGMIFNAKVDSVYISQNFGSYFKNYGSSAIDKKGNFTLLSARFSEMVRLLNYIISRYTKLVGS